MVKETKLLQKRVSELAEKEIIEDSQAITLNQMVVSDDKESVLLAEELVKLKISDTLLNGLNDGQKYAFVKIVEHINNPRHDIIRLKGFAGSGKTYLTKRVIEYINTVYPKHQIALTAPTNKAVQVLSKNSPYSDKSNVFEDFGTVSGKIVFCTIHKLMALKEVIDDEGNQSFLPDKSNSAILNYQYVVIDESSMLSDQLYKQLILFKDKVKLIFMGDPCQIPPIKQTSSFIFSSKCDLNILDLELTEMMRQKGEHPIVDLSVEIRKNLTSAFPVGRLVTKINDNGDGIVHIDGKRNRKQMLEIISKFFKCSSFEQSSNYVKIIAWRNATVKSLNGIVRESLFGKNLPRFVVGDRIIANKALFVRSYNRNFNATTYTIKANTSDEFVIMSVNVQDIHFKEITKYNLFSAIDVTLKCWIIKARNGISTIDICVIHEESVKEYQELLTDLKNTAKKKKDALYWSVYYNVVKWSDDINYNYAISAHKSQGSTYDNVIIIEEDIDYNPNIIERNRIKYTAYTRAKHRLYILK